jgi:hypothetical protein
MKKLLRMTLNKKKITTFVVVFQQIIMYCKKIK